MTTSEPRAVGPAAARIRLWLELHPDTVNVAGEIASDPAFKSDGWPYRMYALDRGDLEAVLAAVAARPSVEICELPHVTIEEEDACEAERLATPTSPREAVVALVSGDLPPGTPGASMAYLEAAKEPPEPAKRYERLARREHLWNTGYRCLLCGFGTGYWPDDGSAEANIFTHMTNRHSTEVDA